MAEDTQHGVAVVHERPWRDAELLREMYVEDGLSTISIADELDCAPSTVQNWLERHGIPRRDTADAVKMGYGHHPNEVPLNIHSKGYVRWNHTYKEGQKYSVFVHRLLAVAEYGFDAVAGNDVHHVNGIKWDNRPDNIEVLGHVEHSSMPVKVTDEDIQDFIERYQNGESTYSIAEDSPVTAGTVARYVRESEVEMRPPGKGRWHAEQEGTDA